MVKRLNDGTIISGNIPTSTREEFFDITKMHQYGLYKAIILNTYFTDDEENFSKLHIEYKIRIVGSEKAGYEYTGCRMNDSFGDPVNFGEVVLRQKDQLVNPLPSSGNTNVAPPEDYDNAYVMIQFLGGYRIPIILGPWSHPGKIFVGATKDKGIRLIKEFNGIRWEVNKNGESIFTYYGGPRTPVPHPTPRIPGVPPVVHPVAARPETAPLQIKIDQTGGLRVVDQNLNEIKMSREEGEISISQYEGTLLPEIPTQYEDGYEVELLPVNFPINEVKLNKNDKKISIVNYETGNVEKLKAEIDGSAGTITFEDVLTQSKTVLGESKLDVTTGGGTQLLIDGSTDEVKAKTVVGDELTASSTNGILAKSSNGATLKLALGKIGLGGPAGELIEEFEKLLTQLDSLITQMQTEVHPTSVGPTGPPTNSAAYATVKAQITAIKAVTSLLKGGI